MSLPARATPPVVLASGSTYRRELLGRILAGFEVVVPAVDESALPLELPPALAGRLAALKANRVAADRPDAVVIGSDQVAECAGIVLGKPGSEARAVDQLRRCAGHPVILHTAVCVVGPGGASRSHIDRTTLQMRPLDDAALRAYVSRDRPLDCAGAFRFETLGAALFSAVQTSDPTAIQGLPLLWLCAALGDFGIRIL